MGEGEWEWWKDTWYVDILRSWEAVGKDEYSLTWRNRLRKDLPEAICRSFQNFCWWARQ